MLKKLVATAVLAALVSAVAIVGFAAPRRLSSPSPLIRAVSGRRCASDACHGFERCPRPDRAMRKVCPGPDTRSTECCHGWGSLIERYHQASDMSLNVWILCRWPSCWGCGCSCAAWAAALVRLPAKKACYEA